MRALILFVTAGLVFSTGADTLTLDSTHSQVTLSGTVASAPLAEQSAGSLKTSVSGTIEISTDGTKLEIKGAALTPNINGSWAPGTNGTASSPADFGGKGSVFGIPITGALRDLFVTATSPAKALSSGSFDASAMVFSFPADSSSVLDYDSFATGKGSKKLAGAGTNQTATVGTFISNNGSETLTIALNATFYFTFLSANDTALTLKGQIVATNGPAEVLPTFTNVTFANGQVVFTATGTSAGTQIQSSTTLTSWSPQTATVGSPDSSTRTYTIPMDKPYDFFRLLQ